MNSEEASKEGVIQKVQIAESIRLMIAQMVLLMVHGLSEVDRRVDRA